MAEYMILNSYAPINLFDGGGDGGGDGSGGAPAAPASAPAGGAETDTVVTSDAAAAKRSEYQELISGDYADEYQADMQRMSQRNQQAMSQLQQRLDAQTPLIDNLMARYGVDSIEELSQAVDEDDTYWEQAADEAGMDADTYKQLKLLERENAQMKQEAELRRRQNMAEAKMGEWIQEGEKIKAMYPSFDLGTESQNPNFLRLLKANIPVQQAYELCHMDEIKAGIAQGTARAANKAITDNIKAGRARPSEAGSRSQPGVQTSVDVSKLTKKDRANIALRVRRGEKVDLSNL